jgi:uncharacterized membrane protein YphA (DoxX/SURF4 family)
VNYVLWIAQALLALEFFFAGGIKLVTPIEEMMKQMPAPLPGWFLQFIGVCEVLAAIGLVLPALLRVKPGLTPLAAAGLVIIMIGAMIISVVYIGPSAGIVPCVTGLIAAFVAYGRWRIAPIGARSRPPAVEVR